MPITPAPAVRRACDVLEYLPVDLDGDGLRRVNQMSAPVFDRTGAAKIQVMMLGPTYDLTPTEIGALGDRLLETAGRAPERIGGTNPGAAR